MDTSDSEAFESADESFDKDDVEESKQISSSSNSSTEQNVSSLILNPQVVKEHNTLEDIDNELKCDFDSDTLENIYLNQHKTVKKSQCLLESDQSDSASNVVCDRSESSGEHLDLNPLDKPISTIELLDIEKELQNLIGSSDSSDLIPIATESSATFLNYEKSLIDLQPTCQNDKLKTFITSEQKWNSSKEKPIEACWEEACRPEVDNKTEYDIDRSAVSEDIYTSKLPKSQEWDKEYKLQSGDSTEIAKIPWKESVPSKQKQSNSEIMQPTKFDIRPELEYSDTGSGWDDDVDWTPIEDTEPKALTKIESTDSGWDDFDAWDTIEDVKEQPQQQIKTQPQREDTSWSSWSGWGVTNLLTTATQGLTNVIESSIGVPSPEEFAIAQKLEKEKSVEKEQTAPPADESGERQSSSGGFGFGNLFTGVTKLVETTGSKVVSTGLDTLESIGKKTMEVLQEGDPGLVKKRTLLGLNPEKPCLSQVLREAKEKAESDDSQYEDRTSVKKKIHFETLFDDYQGLVHLEALEMLSKQCDIKLCTISESMEEKILEDFQETMLQVKELCELPDDEDDDEHMSLDELKVKLNQAVDDLGIPITFKKLLNIWSETESELKTIESDEEVHGKAIDTLAQLTSAAVEQFHKCAELLLVKERRSTADEADSLVQLTTTLTALIGVIAAKFSEKLDSLGSVSKNSDLNALITNVFFEATQSSSYIQDAFQLFVPILQIGAV